MFVSFKVTKDDAKVIDQIVDRAMQEIGIRALGGVDHGRTGVSMDITAVHASDQPLRLSELLGADSFNFSHDICGIVLHIDRKTGRTRDCFVPRFGVQGSPGL